MAPAYQAIVPALWRRQRGATVGLMALVAFYLLVVLKYRWYQWDAGWTPPPRFILPAAPLLIPFVAAAIEALRGPALAAFYTVCLAWSGVLTWSLALVPFASRIVAAAALSVADRVSVNAVPEAMSASAVSVRV